MKPSEIMLKIKNKETGKEWEETLDDLLRSTNNTGNIEGSLGIEPEPLDIEFANHLDIEVRS